MGRSVAGNTSYRLGQELASLWRAPLAVAMALGCTMRSEPEHTPLPAAVAMRRDFQRVLLLQKQADGMVSDPELDRLSQFLIERQTRRGLLPTAPQQDAPGILDSQTAQYRSAVDAYLGRVARQRAQVAVHQFLTRYGCQGAPVVAEAFVKEAGIEELEPVTTAELARAYGDVIAPFILRAYENAGSSPMVYGRILAHVVIAWSPERQAEELVRAVEDQRDIGPSYSLSKMEIRALAISLAGDFFERSWGLRQTVAEIEEDIAEFKAWYEEKMPDRRGK